MTYRTKTYIAGDWTGDKDLIDKLYQWNDSKYWGLHFIDAHEYTQANDNSLPCSIKKSLAERLDTSKTFILIVGDHTKRLTKGSCYHCDSYNSWSGYCTRGHSLSLKSYIEYECDKAKKDGLRIVVIYNNSIINRSLCPDAVEFEGVHIRAYYRGVDNKFYWNYDEIKNAIMDK